MAHQQSAVCAAEPLLHWRSAPLSANNRTGRQHACPQSAPARQAQSCTPPRRAIRQQQQNWDRLSAHRCTSAPVSVVPQQADVPTSASHALAQRVRLLCPGAHQNDRVKGHVCGAHQRQCGECHASLQRGCQSCQACAGVRAVLLSTAQAHAARKREHRTPASTAVVPNAVQQRLCDVRVRLSAPLPNRLQQRARTRRRQRLRTGSTRREVRTPTDSLGRRALLAGPCRCARLCAETAAQCARTR